jgi:L-fuculose-phosphate aldolase
MGDLAELITYVAGMMFERRLTDISGGNISARDGDRIYITPRQSGSRKHWRLEPHDILSAHLGTDELLDNPRCSRESKVHLSIYRRLEDVGAVLHAHPFHVLPFCVRGEKLEMVLESGRKFGVVETIEYAPAHSRELAENVVRGLERRRENIRLQAGAVLAPSHGIFVAALDLLSGLDALERIDWNAWCILAQEFREHSPK